MANTEAMLREVNNELELLGSGIRCDMFPFRFPFPQVHFGVVDPIDFCNSTDIEISSKFVAWLTDFFKSHYTINIEFDSSRHFFHDADYDKMEVANLFKESLGGHL